MNGSRLDPRTKLVIVLSISSLGVFIGDPWVLLGVAGVSWLLATLLGGNPGGAARRWRRMLWLFLPIVLMQSVFAPGGMRLLGIGSLTLLSSGGLLKGLAMLCRLLIVVVAASIMTTSNSRDVVQGLIQWKLPYEIAFMVSLAARFLPMLGEEVRDSLTALQLRGIEPEALPLRKRLQLYSYLLMPVMVSTVIRAEQLSLAMEMRAFRAFPTRTSHRSLQLRGADYAWMLGSAAVTVAALVALR
ncbi:MAG: energy-coupling factor transporter transmembrane component T family protein [Bacillota bacterium]|jgi:energy-coupling factor transport system permease protein